jgi:serine/threonine-protein kinase
LPFAGSKADVIVAHVRDPVPHLSDACAHTDAPPEIDEVIQKCLAKKPDDRFASMDELLVALRELASRGGQLAFLGNDRSIGGRDRSESSCSFLRSDASGSYSSSDLSSGALGRPSMFPGSVSPSEARLRAGERRKKRLLVATGVSAFALVLAASVILFSSDEGSTEVGPAPTVALGPMNAADLPDPKELVRLKLRSTPRGAAVVVDNSLICDATPCDVIWRGDEARSGREVTFHFRLAGSKSVSVTKTIDSDNLAVSASLARLSERRSERKREARRPSLTARPPPPAPKPKPTPKKSAKSVKPNKIDDFKDNPY